MMKFELESDGDVIAVAIAEKMPKFMKKMSHRRGCTVFARQATEREINEYFRS
jgi:hypothetical protein